MGTIISRYHGLLDCCVDFFLKNDVLLLSGNFIDHLLIFIYWLYHPECRTLVP